ncbi:hypothetical protein [Streptomyces sp. 8K308]|uniref:hypothetical protein n=1 Tax=Streptomyces sp. 8K308 TaxID=2530388 RepID=UPI001404DDB6|nr:hypothetical protein [Streptomyces sp. 8K308]
MATGPAFVDHLPPPPPPEQIIALKQPGADPHTHRQYAWNGWTFALPPDVSRPASPAA